MKRYTELPAFSSDQEVCTSLTKVADRKIHPKEILLSMINKQFVLVDKRYIQMYWIHTSNTLSLVSYIWFTIRQQEIPAAAKFSVVSQRFLVFLSSGLACGTPHGN